MGNTASQSGTNGQQSQPNGCATAQNPSTPGEPPCGADQQPNVPAHSQMPPQHLSSLPPPMMLSGATPVKGPAPIADEHRHLYKMSQGVTQPRRQKQPPCGRSQAPCPPTPCPPMACPQAFPPAQQQQYDQSYYAGNQYATPSHGVTGGTSYLLGPAAPSYMEGPADPIPPYHDGQHPHPSANGKIVCQQIYPKILQNCQHSTNGSASASHAGVSSGSTLTPTMMSYASNGASPELAVHRPIIGGAL